MRMPVLCVMKKITLLLLLLSHHVYAQQLHWRPLPAATDASFRGLSVVDDHMAWVSGSKGYTGKTTNGGENWVFAKVPGFEQCDFRSVYAFDSLNAVIANAGAPAYILRTTDGGRTWTKVYENDDSAAFIDGIDFWNNREGMIFGDPLHGRMLLLRTTNGGGSWQEVPVASRPVMDSGEASFAASGTAIRCLPGGNAAIATGGRHARLWLTKNKGINWHPAPTPMMHGPASAGIFSLAYLNGASIIVGGDYKRDTLRADHIFLSKKDFSGWLKPAIPTRGYRECVEYINNKIVIATGPAGIDISYDGGMNWQPFCNDKLYHVVRKARKGKLIIAAGGAGKIALIK